MDGAGSYSVAHRAGLLPTEPTGMWGWILLRSPHQGRGFTPAPAPTKQRPGHNATKLVTSTAFLYNQGCQTARTACVRASRGRGVGDPCCAALTNRIRHSPCEGLGVWDGRVPLGNHREGGVSTSGGGGMKPPKTGEGGGSTDRAISQSL